MLDPRGDSTGGSTRNAGRNLVLALTLIFVLAAVALSTGLVLHTAWNHDLSNSPFALAFAVLSARAALAWVSWSSQQARVGRKLVGEATR
jgi:hypothetical protein